MPSALIPQRGRNPLQFVHHIRAVCQDRDSALRLQANSPDHSHAGRVVWLRRSLPVAGTPALRHLERALVQWTQQIAVWIDGLFLKFAAIRLIEQVDRVDDLDRAAAFLDLAGDLEDAADVAGGDHLGPGRGDVVHLAAAEPLGHLGLGQVVGPGGAAADLASPRAGPARGRGSSPSSWRGWVADLLAVAEVAGVVIGHLHRQRVRRRDRAERDEELGDVA